MDIDSLDNPIFADNVKYLYSFEYLDNYLFHIFLFECSDIRFIDKKVVVCYHVSFIPCLDYLNICLLESMVVQILRYIWSLSWMMVCLKVWIYSCRKISIRIKKSYVRILLDELCYILCGNLLFQSVSYWGISQP